LVAVLGRIIERKKLVVAELGRIFEKQTVGYCIRYNIPETNCWLLY